MPYAYGAFEDQSKPFGPDHPPLQPNPRAYKMADEMISVFASFVLNQRTESIATSGYIQTVESDEVSKMLRLRHEAPALWAEVWQRFDAGER